MCIRDRKRVILGEGTLAVEDMKIVENYIRVAGKLNFKVLYVTDEGETRLSCLEGRIPFEEMIYLEQDPVGDLFIQSSSVDLTVTAIHSRKLNLKTLAEISICSEGRKEAEITTDIDSDTPLYKLSLIHIYAGSIRRNPVGRPGTYHSLPE